jgi:hypothetical protein
MEISTLITKIISLIYIITGIGILAGTINFPEIINNLENSPAIRYMAGVAGIIIGVILVTYHNSWVGNWTILITLISWLFLIGGVVVVLLPRSISWGKGFLNNSKLLGIFMLVIGAVFGCLRFFN